jgi:hypothetical protein
MTRKTFRESGGVATGTAAKKLLFRKNLLTDV